MIAIDTNVIVRYIVKDDEEQSRIAASFLKRTANKNILILINNIVLCELVWVLNRGYDYSKLDIATCS